MRHTVNLQLVLYDLGDKYSNQNWNNNFNKIDTEINELKIKTKNIDQSAATFTTSVTAPSFIGNADTASKLKTARSIKIGNKALSFDGSENLVFTLDDMSIAAKEHTHSYLPLTGGTLQDATLVNQILYNSWGSWQQGFLGTAAIRKSAVNNEKVSFIHYKSTSGAYTLSAYGDIGVSVEYSSNETINGSNNIDKQAILLNAEGYTSFPLRVSCPEFFGKLTGNADTATKLKTGRSINGTTFDGSGDITTANWGTARNLTIGNTAKNVNGGSDIGWSLAEIGAHPSANKVDVSLVTHSDYPNNGSTHVPTMNFMSYWNGAYNITGNSNLQYCDRGRFGSIVTKNVGDYALTDHDHDSTYLKLSGGTMTGSLIFAEGGGLHGYVSESDMYRIIGVKTGTDEGYLEIATSDNGNEAIYVRQYNMGSGTHFGSIARTATLLDTDGNSRFPKSVVAGENLYGQSLVLGGIITTESGSRNHEIKPGHTGDDVMEFRECGSRFRFIRPRTNGEQIIAELYEGHLSLQEPEYGEGAEIVLHAPLNATNQAGIHIDNYYGMFRVFGEPSRDGTTNPGNGITFGVNPYSETIEAVGYRINLMYVDASGGGFFGSDITCKGYVKGRYYAYVNGSAVPGQIVTVRSTAPPSLFGSYVVWAN